MSLPWIKRLCGSPTASPLINDPYRRELAILDYDGRVNLTGMSQCHRANPARAAGFSVAADRDNIPRGADERCKKYNFLQIHTSGAGASDECKRSAARRTGLVQRADGRFKIAQRSLGGEAQSCFNSYKNIKIRR